MPSALQHTSLSGAPNSPMTSSPGPSADHSFINRSLAKSQEVSCLSRTPSCVRVLITVTLAYTHTYGPIVVCILVTALPQVFATMANDRVPWERHERSSSVATYKVTMRSPRKQHHANAVCAWQDKCLRRQKLQNELDAINATPAIPAFPIKCVTGRPQEERRLAAKYESQEAALPPASHACACPDILCSCFPPAACADAEPRASVALQGQVGR